MNVSIRQTNKYNIDYIMAANENLPKFPRRTINSLKQYPNIICHKTDNFTPKLQMRLLNFLVILNQDNALIARATTNL